ncbi:hypothetical protein ACFQX7_08390 [Luedemannella flava]
MSTGKLPSAGRARDAWRVVQRDGTRGLAQRVARVAYRRLGAASLEFPLHLEDVADSRGLSLAQPHRRPAPGTPLTIGWICTLPAPAPADTRPCSAWSRPPRPPGTPACCTCTTGTAATWPTTSR